MSISVTITSKVIEIKSWFEHLFRVLSFGILRPPSCKLLCCKRLGTKKNLFQVSHEKLMVTSSMKILAA